MAIMDCKLGDTVVGKIAGYKAIPQAQKIISTALDGTAYGQKTGNAIHKYEVNVYCSTALNRTLLDFACQGCTEVTIILRNGLEVIGIIEEETIKWKEWVDGHGVGKFTLIGV